MNKNSEIINLCWTGGWDSTFRLLQLVLSEKKIVQPHYIIWPQSCTGNEINSIVKIQSKLLSDHDFLTEYILPVKYIDENSIKEDETITNEHIQINKEYLLPNQYELIARYCKTNNIDKIELGILSNERYAYFIDNAFYFKYFHFPLMGLTKKDIAEITKKNGWTKYMVLTVFCRKPKNNKPCGLCGPCTDAVIAGIGWRLPLKSRIIAHIQIPFRKWWRKNYLKQNNKISKFIKNLARGRY